MSSISESFEQAVQRYRRHGQVAACGFTLFMLSIAAGVFVGKGPLPVFLVFALIGWLTVFIAAVTAPSLKCPKCEELVVRTKGAHCPICGNQSLSQRSWLHVRSCSSCGQELNYGKGARRFKIHCCMHCGTHLDARGL